MRGLGSVESVRSKRRQAAWTRQVATAGAVLTSVDRSAVPRARALPQSSRCRLAPAPAPPGPTPPSSSAPLRRSIGASTRPRHPLVWYVKERSLERAPQLVAACPTTTLEKRNPFAQVDCCGAPRPRCVLRGGALPPLPLGGISDEYRLNVSGRGDSSLYNFSFVSTHTHAPTHTQRATLPQRTGAHTHRPRAARRARDRETERARAVTVAVTHTDRERRGSSIYRYTALAISARRTPCFGCTRTRARRPPDTLVERVQHQTSRSKGCTRLGCIRTGGAL